MLKKTDLVYPLKCVALKWINRLSSEANYPIYPLSKKTIFYLLSLQILVKSKFFFAVPWHVTYQMEGYEEYFSKMKCIFKINAFC